MFMNLRRKRISLSTGAKHMFKDSELEGMNLCWKTGFLNLLIQ